ncbi:2895_t:CDS:2 [Funneliformis geosporum]|uniref:Palmitoyltransferase n=1 Tax=Funneliformis geosporum TaxID=1117311 RepID=A0A9W4SXJ5_9GLOM|nr:4262_t:CDS:2 [Funneliformis geosporum]CAI2184265.1 2895_t:CDS:2 [Funneliformis geosporum]
MSTSLPLSNIHSSSHSTMKFHRVSRSSSTTSKIPQTRGYFEFSLKFIVEDEKYKAQAFFKEDVDVYNVQRRRSTWSFLGFIFSFIAIFTSIKVSLTDTADSLVMKEGKERDMTYSRTKGIPVVVDGWCCICRSNVESGTRHCKYCNKCVQGFDHHCRWLNCCIAEANYRTFIIFIISSLSVSIMSLWLALCAINLYFGAETDDDYLMNHLMDMTTVEYLSHQQQRRYYSDHYEDEDDENPWRRPYYPNPWKRRIMGIIRKFYMLTRFCKRKSKYQGRDSSYGFDIHSV